MAFMKTFQNKKSLYVLDSHQANNILNLGKTISTIKSVSFYYLDRGIIG
jgi:hypothetical protein